MTSLFRASTHRIIATARTWSPAAIVIAIGLLVTSVAFLIAHQAEERRVHKALQFRVEWRAKDLQTKISLGRDAILAAAIHAAAQPNIDFAEFSGFMGRVGANNRSTASIGWIEPVTRDQRANFEARWGFHILDNAPDGTRVTAPERDDYMPIVVQKRFDGRPLSLGLDLSLRPDRRHAMDVARDSGGPKAAMMPERVAVADPAYVIFWPIFDSYPVPATISERRAHLRGFVDGVFQVADVLNNAIIDTPGIPESLEFYLSDSIEEPTTADSFQLVATYSPAEKVVRPAHGPGSVSKQTKYDFTRSFDVRGQHWRVEWFFSPQAAAAERSIGPLSVLIAGLLLTSVLAAYVVGGRRQVSLVQTLVDRRTAELTQTNSKLETLIDASPHAIVCLDAERRVILWNAAAEHLFGYTAEEVLDRPYPLILPEESDEFDDRFRRLASGEILRNMASHRRHQDGSAIDTSSSASALFDTAGALQGVIFVIEDARERNLVQGQLRQAQKMEAIGQLTGGLAHDFNNLLGIVLGNLDLLAERFTTGSEDRELTDAAVQAALRGAELTRQLLAFSRQQPLAPKLTYLPPVLEATAKLLQRTLGEAITFELNVSDALWPVLIDVSQLESTLLNLSVNARDAMPNGGRLTIEATNVSIEEHVSDINPEATPGDYALIAVSDTGCGMSPDVLAHVFEPFFTTKGNRGTGLGLSMVHGFLKQSGGYTKIYSEPDHGTTVRLYLPRAADGQVPEADAPFAEPLSRGQEVILVVEDNKGLRDLALRHLQSLGYRTLPAADGNSALEIIQGGAPIDLLFTDVIMPGGLDGRALAEAARRLRPELRVLFTSGFTAAAASAATEDQFGSNLLSKPYRKGELARRIRAALDASER